MLAVIGAIVAAVVIGVLFSYEPGYVLIAYGTTRIEFTLFVFLLLYIAALLVGTLAWWFLKRFAGAPRRWRNRREARADRRAAVRFTRGIVALAQGQLQVAERALEQAAHGVLALPALLAAARAADLAGVHERRDAYLRRAADSTPDAAPAVLISQAQFDLAHGDHERALATLQSLRQGGGRHPGAERDLARVYAALGEYAKLFNLLPALANQPTLDSKELEDWAAAAAKAVIVHDGLKPATVLRRMPSAVRDAPRVRCGVAAAQVQIGEPEAAAETLERTLKAGYDGASVEAYARLSAVPAATRLRTIEGWLARHGEKPALLKAAARVARELQLWGSARGYLGKLPTQEVDPATALLLGEIAEREGRNADACTAYREGLERAAQPALSDERRG